MKLKDIKQSTLKSIIAVTNNRGFTYETKQMEQAYHKKAH